MVRTRAQTAQTGQPLTGKRPQGIRKSAPRKRGRLREQPASCSTTSQTSSHQHLPAPVQNRGRKRKQSIENALEPNPDPDPDPTGQEHTPQEQAGSDQADPPKHTSDEHSRKRRRTSLEQQDPPHHSLRSAGNSPPLSRPSAHRLEPPALPASPAPVPVPEEAASGGTKEKQDIIDFWMREGSWPKKYFEQDDDTRKYFEMEMDQTTLRQRRLFECYDPAARLRFAQKKALASPSRKRSGSNSSTATSMPPPSMLPPSLPPSMIMTASDQRPREEKSAPYASPNYTIILGTKGSYMTKSPLGITDESRNLCKTLLDTEQPVPTNSLFDDDIFEKVCENLQEMNEATVVVDILRLIVPSAVHHALRAKHLEHLDLTDVVNAGWNNSFPLTGTRPQPDYSVGFGRKAFTEVQLDKLLPFTGDTEYQSLFMATAYMYFPFLTSEVKCGTTGLDIADRQNAHSMTLAVRAIVELFRTVKREDEVNRQILAFSISHNQSMVRIYGHYPVITGKDTKYYRYPIYEFSFTTREGMEKWTAHRFIKNVYDIWVPDHFKKICSAIDQLLLVPDSGDQPLSEATGLSQNLGNLMQPEQPTTIPSQNLGNLMQPEPPTATPDTSFTRPKAAKRRKGQVKT